MRKHSLTILVGISIFLIFIHYSLFSTKNEVLKINSFSILLNVDNNRIEGKSSYPVNQVTLSSPDKIPNYKVNFIDKQNFYISFLNIPEEGWIGPLYLKCISSQSTIIKKVFISLEKENIKPLNFFIKSFSPTYSKKWGNPCLEIEIKETGNLQGISLQIESPKSYRNKYILPNLVVHKGDTWKIIFAHSKKEEEEINIRVNSKIKEIKIPFKLSETIGAFSFLRENNQKIEDFLIYSNKKENIEAEDILKSIKINIETIKNIKGFPYEEILSEHIIRTYKAKIGASKKVVRKDPYIPFKEKNSYVTTR